MITNEKLIEYFFNKSYIVMLSKIVAEEVDDYFNKTNIRELFLKTYKGDADHKSIKRYSIWCNSSAYFEEPKNIIRRNIIEKMKKTVDAKEIDYFLDAFTIGRLSDYIESQIIIPELYFG